jgi:beta-lactam-binding protein with PASTA domain
VGDSGAVLEVASGKVVLDPAAVVGKSYPAAARALVRLGLVPVRAEAERPGGDGTVITALPAGRLKIGSIVTLTVGVEPSAPTAGMAPAG